MQRRRLLLVGFALVWVGAAWAGCKSAASSASGSGDDAGDASDDMTAQPDNGQPCNPCLAVCACTPGDTYFSPGNCMTVFCGPSGTWGGVGLGCMDAADDGEAGETDGTTGDGGGDGSTESGNEGGSDASTDVATEGSD